MKQYDLRNGDILLYRGTDKFGKLIKWFTMSEYSHAAILVDSGRARTVAEALSTGFTIHDYGTDLDKFIEEGKISVYRYEQLSSVQFNEVQKYCYNSVGLPYDWGDISKIVLNRITFGLTFNDSYYQLMCSEACQRGYKKAKLLLTNKPDDYVTPADISKSKLLKRVY